jgi:DNA modification methylase
MKIEQVKISELKPAEYNPRQMTEKQAEELTKSLKEFGIVDPIIVNSNPERKNIIVGGHQRTNVAKQMGMTEVPVFYIDLDEKKERELNLRLNKNLGEWDYDMLANFEEDMLLDTGFDSEELDKIFQLEPDAKDDEIPENVPANAKLGDIYQLGEHRVVCGDSTKKEDVEKLMDGKMADMVFTDPPYNVDYKGMQNSKQWDSIANDEMTAQEFMDFLKDVFINYVSFMKESGAYYICHADKSHMEFRQAFESVGLCWRATIIWEKNSPAFNFAQYKYKHEPIFYCYKKGQRVSWYGDRKQHTIWRAKKERGEHPTIKPVELINNAIINSSKREDIVLDLFLGSGSTLIACEKTSRICYGMELEPKYIDVIIKRWEDYTGNEAIKL